MGTLDKTVRVIIAAIIAVLFFAKVITGTLGIVLLIIAIILLLTSLLNFCPLYTVCGLSSCKQQVAK